GLGDNSDQYPTDPKAKYDSDGDGIADAYDMFPDTSTMDNWFDVAIRVVGFSVLIGALLLVLKKKNPPITKYTDWQQFQNEQIEQDR
ncbi:MAG: hypothetical protein QMC52_04050, partial [Candidatus Poseidoniaceae archaeon]